MHYKEYPNPRVTTFREEDFPITGAALRELMHAVLAKGKNFRFKAKGTSMAPFIRNEDFITISPPTKIGIGSIVAFVRPETRQLVVHRVIGRRKKELFIAGDGSSLYTDGWIPLRNIIGQISKIERNGNVIHLSLGIEKYGIAILSRLNWLTPIRVFLAKFMH